MASDQRLDYLARCVHDGSCRRMTWTALRALYFRGEDDKEAARALAAWADEHAIDFRTEPGRIAAGNRMVNEDWIVMEPR